MTIYLYNALIYQILMSKFYFMSIVNVFIHAFIAMIIALSHLKKNSFVHQVRLWRYPYPYFGLL